MSDSLAMQIAENPVDLRQLDRYTGGSRTLNEEILRLFADQCRETLSRLEALAHTADAKSWRETAHSLKGAARGVGAFALAKAAAEAESADPANAPVRRAALQRLRGQSQAVQSFIESFLRS
jgi:HPt (histidine-containing phosphotransfer) domain-containing protein